jgi:hypothetical protein
LTDKTPTRSTRDERLTRLLDAGELAADCDPRDKLYSHSVFAQTSLPYRNPGDDVRVWTRSNGQIGLRIEAGTAWNPDKGDFMEIGLPYGPKPRLLLAYLNAEALKQQSAEIEVERSLTAFVKAVRLDTKGRNINAVKEQLTRLSASTMRLGMTAEGEAVTIKSDIVSSFSLWWPKDERQRVIWPSAVKLSAEYFESLQRHAVPLHPNALAALSGSAMALDVYAWLAQRLHRIEWDKPAFIPWTALQVQFGGHYERIRKFREVFSQTVRDVQSQYRAADIELDGKGMTLRHSATPVRGRTALVIRKG